jgi:hypothetical protein
LPAQLAVKPRYETPANPRIVGSYGTRATAWAKRELGIDVRGWQEYVIWNLLAYDSEGRLVYREGLVSTARQNGKSVIVRVIIGWILDEGRDLAAFREWRNILAAAHDAKQARITYLNVFTDLITLPRLVAATKGDRLTRFVKLTAKEGIRIGNLSFDTATSQADSVRGTSNGLIAWDEVLTQRDYDLWRALRPTQVAVPSAQVLFTSTAGDADSVVLRDLFDKLVRQSTGAEKRDEAFWGAWWQSEDPTPRLDWDQIAQANPALAEGRLSKDFIVGELSGPPDIFRQERLNHWLEQSSPGAFNAEAWARNRVPLPLEGHAGPFCLGVDVHSDWTRATISVGAMREDKRVGVEVFKDMRAESLTAADVIAAVHSFPGTTLAVSYDQASAGAPSFRRDMENSAIPWDELKPSAVCSAHMDFSEMVHAGALAIDDPLVDAQIPYVARRPVGPDGAFRFSRKDSTGPIDAVNASAFAAHNARYFGAGQLMAL